MIVVRLVVPAVGMLSLCAVAKAGTPVAMRGPLDAGWQPTVPGLVNMVAAAAGPQLRAAFAAAGTDGIRPAQSVALVPLAAGGMHASALADRLRVSRQPVAQAIAGLERRGYVTRVADPVDARARLIELTSHGRDVLRVIHSHELDLERKWPQVLGRPLLSELCDTLQVLLSNEPGAAGE